SEHPHPRLRHRRRRSRLAGTPGKTPRARTSGPKNAVRGLTVCAEVGLPPGRTATTELRASAITLRLRQSRSAHGRASRFVPTAGRKTNINKGVDVVPGGVPGGRQTASHWSPFSAHAASLLVRALRRSLLPVIVAGQCG